MSDEDRMELYEAMDGYHRLFPRAEWPRLIREAHEAAAMAALAGQARGDAPGEEEG